MHRCRPAPAFHPHQLRLACCAAVAVPRPLWAPYLPGRDGSSPPRHPPGRALLRPVMLSLVEGGKADGDAEKRRMNANPRRRGRPPPPAGPCLQASSRGALLVRGKTGGVRLVCHCRSQGPTCRGASALPSTSEPVAPVRRVAPTGVPGARSIGAHRGRRDARPRVGGGRARACCRTPGGKGGAGASVPRPTRFERHPIRHAEGECLHITLARGHGSVSDRSTAAAAASLGRPEERVARRVEGSLFTPPVESVSPVVATKCPAHEGGMPGPAGGGTAR
jgi:hypothetical protein